MNIKFDIELTSSQKKAYDLIHDKETRYLVARWSRQQGKTIFSEVILIEYLFKKNTFNGYISPTFAQGQKVYKEIVQLIEPTGIIKTANASTLTITTIFNSTLQFFSVQSYTAIRGNTIRGLLVMDEVAFFADQLPDGSDIWGNVIYAIIKANIKRNKIIAISTPNGKRGCFYKFYNNALNKVPGWKELACTIYDDDLVTEERIQEIKQNVSDLAFRQEFLVEWLDNGLTFFQGFENCFTDFIYDENCNQYIGIDLSGNGSDETVLTKINQKNQVKQFVIKGTLDQKYQQISNIINITNNLKNAYIENNGLAVPMINEIRKLVTNKNIIQEFNTTNKSKNEILAAVAIDISKKEIYFDKNDSQLYSQFSTFTAKYSKTGQVQLMAMAGFHDDRILSLGIAHQAKEKGIVLGNYVIQFGPRTTHKIRR